MKEIIDILINNGYEAYIVGGYVRDYLLGMQSKDIDIATNAPINIIMKLFSGRGKAFKEYYAYHIEEDGYSYDITSYRKELKYRRNKPIEIEPAKDFKTDILRRDFTINTFAINEKGTLVDILNAKNDLDNKLIKVVGNTKTRLIEDKTRILRALRFSSTLDFELDKEILDFLSSKDIHLITEIPKEYIKSELDKIFDSAYPLKFFEYLNKYNLKKYLGIISYNDKIIKTYNKYGIWSQIETNLPFTKKELKIINDIKKLINNNDITYEDVANYDKDVIYNASLILGLLEKVKILEEISSLHSIIDIDLSIDIMIKYIQVKDLKRVYRNIEKLIIKGSLANNSADIERYLENLKYE